MSHNLRNIGLHASIPSKHMVDFGNTTWSSRGLNVLRLEGRDADWWAAPLNTLKCAHC